jgi:hypothetical protein
MSDFALECAQNPGHLVKVASRFVFFNNVDDEYPISYPGLFLTPPPLVPIFTTKCKPLVALTVMTALLVTLCVLLILGPSPSG